MIKRAIFYVVAIILVVPAAIWLAFGPGIVGPLEFMLWPGERLLALLDPAGSFPASALPGAVLAAAVIWLGVFLLADLGVTRISRRMHRGGG